MKSLLNILLLIPILVFSQVPLGVGYQGIATDAAGFELINQSISIRASIISGSTTGTIEWQEIHNTATDTFGLFNLTIGQGTSTGNGAQANFADITWGANTHFLKIEMDVNGGTNYSLMGTNQMMSVPYALYAENANINYDSISTLLSNDSTFITTVGGGIGGGGCDYKFPEGISRESLTLSITGSSNYIVPSSKRLYITNVFTSDGKLFIDNKCIVIEQNNRSGYSSRTLVNPIIVDQGEVLSSDNTGANINGFLVDVNTDIEIVTMEVNNTTSFIVPSNKILIVNNLIGYATFQVNGIPISFWPNGNITMTSLPLVLKSGDQLDHDSNSVFLFNGYLVDENFFADCGGGGSSSTVDPRLNFLIPYIGCTDSNACNYNVIALFNDSSCSGLTGCTDSLSPNYNQNATCDDGSCLVGIYGCTNSLALNYNQLANIDDGSCLYNVYGCTDSTAFNYNPLATIDDGSCVPIVYGCTDSTALNYNSLANIDDGSCIAGNLVIGDFFRGGIIFYFDGNGGGLIAAPLDQIQVTNFNYGPEWGGTGTSLYYQIPGANGTNIGSGYQNTIDILASNPLPLQNNNPIAAIVCDTLTLGGFSDWFLPSKDELNEMYLNLVVTGVVSNFNISNQSFSDYWTSTESQTITGWPPGTGGGGAYAWKQSFFDGSQSETNKYNSFNVRAIRAF